MADRPLFTFAPQTFARPAVAPATGSPGLKSPAAGASRLPGASAGTGSASTPRRRKLTGWRAGGALAAVGVIGVAAVPWTGSPAVAGCPCANRAASGHALSAAPGAYAAALPYAAVPYVAPTFVPHFPGQYPPQYAAPAAAGYGGAGSGAWGNSWPAAGPGAFPGGGIAATAVAADSSTFQPVPRRAAAEQIEPRTVGRVAAGPAWWQDGSQRRPILAPRPGDPAPPLPNRIPPADRPLPPLSETDDPLDADSPESGSMDTDLTAPPAIPADPSFGELDRGPQAPPRGGEAFEPVPSPVRAPQPLRIDAPNDGPTDGAAEGGSTGDAPRGDRPMPEAPDADALLADAPDDAGLAGEVRSAAQPVRRSVRRARGRPERGAVC